MKTNHPYLVEYEGETYAGWPREDSWVLIELNEDGAINDLSSGTEVFDEPKVLEQIFFFKQQ